MAPQPNTDAPNYALGVRLMFNPRAQASPRQDRRLSGRFKLIIVADMQDALGSVSTDTLGTVAFADTPKQIFGEGDCITKFGTRSGVRRLYDRVRAQVPAGLSIYGVGIRCTGTAATALLRVMGTAQGAGRIRVYILDRLAFVDVNAGDTQNTIANALCAAIMKLEAIPFTPAFNPVDILTGVANAGIRLIAKVGGTTIQLIDPGALTASTTVAVTGTAIRVTLKHSGVAITATSNEVIAALIASAQAMALLWTVTTAPGHSGAGTPTALVATALTDNEVVLTYITPGEHGNDHPIAVDIDDTVRLETSAGVRGGIAAGKITFGGGNTGAAATLTTEVATKTAGASLGNGQAESVSAAAVVTAIQQTGSMTCDAIVDPSDTKIVRLLYKKGEVFNFPSISLSTSIAPQTATLATGTAGSGVPSLTNALNNLGPAEAFAEWVTCFGTDSDDTPIEAMVTHLRTYGDGYRQKEQFLTWASAKKLTTAGAALTAITPSVIFEDAAKSSPGRFAAGWCPGARQQAAELAAHRAAARCAQKRPTKNMDSWPLVSNDPRVPLGLPSVNVRPDDDTSGQARTVYFLSPYVVRDDGLVVESDITTYGGTLPGWADSPVSHGAANYRQELLAELSLRFTGVESVDKSPPRVDGVTDADAIERAIHSVNVRLQEQNLFDGADFVKPLIEVQRDDEANGNGYLIYAPYRGPKPVHKITGQIAPVG